MKLARFWGGPVDGLVLEAERLEPCPRLPWWAEDVVMPDGRRVHFDDRATWNLCPGFTFRPEPNGATVHVLRGNDVWAYAWCLAHHEYEYDLARRQVT